MLTSKQLLNRIDEIVERAYLDFTYSIIGEDFLTDEQKIQVEALGLVVGTRPLIELLYMIARQRSTPGYKTDQTLDSLLQQIANTGVLPVLNDEDQYTLDHAKANIDKAIDEAKNTVKSKVKSVILEANNDHKQELATTAIESIPQRQEIESENTNSLMDKITMAAVGTAVITSFRRDFTTILTETVNSAVVDETRLNARAFGQTPGDVLVYKEIVDDSRTSPECRKLHTVSGSNAHPRLYKLSELVSNGTNVGLPRHQWKAVIGATHPNCRCTLKVATEKQIQDHLKDK